jgi:hypothetical protein
VHIGPWCLYRLHAIDGGDLGLQGSRWRIIVGHMTGNGRPPKFVQYQEVRIVDIDAAVDERGNPIDVSELLGEVLGVADARPTGSGDGWLIAFSGEDAGYAIDVWLPEGSAEQAAPPEDWMGWWEDRISIDFVTNVVWWQPEQEDDDTEPETAEDVASEAIAEAAKQVVEDLVEAERVEWDWEMVSDAQETQMNVTVHSPKNLLGAYERIIAAPDRAWSQRRELARLPRVALGGTARRTADLPDARN